MNSALKGALVKYQARIEQREDPSSRCEKHNPRCEFLIRSISPGIRDEVHLLYVRRSIHQLLWMSGSSEITPNRGKNMGK